MIKLLNNGVWQNAVEDTPELQQIRAEQKQRWFRDWITVDGKSGFKG